MARQCLPIVLSSCVLLACVSLLVAADADMPRRMLGEADSSPAGDKPTKPDRPRLGKDIADRARGAVGLGTSKIKDRFNAEFDRIKDKFPHRPDGKPIDGPGKPDDGPSKPDNGPGKPANGPDKPNDGPGNGPGKPDNGPSKPDNGPGKPDGTPGQGSGNGVSSGVSTSIDVKSDGLPKSVEVSKSDSASSP